MYGGGRALRLSMVVFGLYACVWWGPCFTPVYKWGSAFTPVYGGVRALRLCMVGSKRYACVSRGSGI